MSGAYFSKIKKNASALGLEGRYVSHVMSAIYKMRVRYCNCVMKGIANKNRGWVEMSLSAEVVSWLAGCRQILQMCDESGATAHCK